MELPEPRRPADEPSDESDTDEPPAAEPPAAEPPRPARPARGDGLVAEEAADESDDPVEPPEPVVSANATGTDATAEPTPNATASAPTRPT